MAVLPGRTEFQNFIYWHHVQHGDPLFCNNEHGIGEYKIPAMVASLGEW